MLPFMRSLWRGVAYDTQCKEDRSTMHCEVQSTDGMPNVWVHQSSTIKVPAHRCACALFSSIPREMPGVQESILCAHLSDFLTPIGAQFEHDGFGGQNAHEFLKYEFFERLMHTAIDHEDLAEPAVITIKGHAVAVM